MMSEQDALAFISENGPQSLMQVANQFNTDSMMAGAVLSNLRSSNKVLITKTKGTPLYYLSEQKEAIQLIAKRFDARETEIYTKLKNEKVLFDSYLRPLERILLKSMPDFAFTLVLKVGGEPTTFWHWYLTTPQEVVEILRAKFAQQQPKSEPQATQEQKPTPVAPEQTVQETPEQPRLAQAQQQTKLNSLDTAKLNEFGKNVVAKLNSAQFSLQSFTEHKKTEIEFHATLNNPLGNIRFYIHAFDKKKLTESELSVALLQSTLQRLPLIVITTGELTKKGDEFRKEHGICVNTLV